MTADPTGATGANQGGVLTDRATVDALLAELPMSDDGTGHVADCGYTHEAQTCGCYTLPGRLAAIVAAARADERERIARAIEALRPDAVMPSPSYRAARDDAARVARGGEQR